MKNLIFILIQVITMLNDIIFISIIGLGAYFFGAQKEALFLFPVIAAYLILFNIWVRQGAFFAWKPSNYKKMYMILNP